MKTIRKKLFAVLATLALPAWSLGQGIPALIKAAPSAVAMPAIGLSQPLSETDLGRIQSGLILQIKQQIKTAEVGKAAPVYRRMPMDKTKIYVLDGDTIYYGDKGTAKLKIRIAGIDAPEIKHYSAGKFEDQAYGPEATQLGRAIVHRAKKVEYLPLGLDKYGRTLAHIFVDDKLYALELLKKGLAYETVTKYGNNGCPDLAAAILAAARTYPRLPFKNPHDWRASEWSAEREQADLQKDLALPRIAMDKSFIRFDDGDTIFYKDMTLRILGMDTPEIIHEKDGIFENQAYGPEAAALTKNLILKATKVEYLAAGQDRYGRTLAHVFIDNELLSVPVIKAGLAYEDISKFGANGHPGYSRLILAAGRSMPTPPFENPLYWRAKYQHKTQPDSELVAGL